MVRPVKSTSTTFLNFLEIPGKIRINLWKLSARNLPTQNTNKQHFISHAESLVALEGL